MRKRKRYARTVNKGERPLIVCTSETGICDVAMELRICPASWKRAKGRAAETTSRDGYRIPFFNAGMEVFSDGKTDDRYERMRHHAETNPNWTIVRVIGFGSVVRISLDDVLVSAEVMYQTTQSP